MGPKEVKLFSNSDTINILVEDQKKSWKIKEEISGGIINADAKNTNTLVISDEEFNKLFNKVPKDKVLTYYSYNIKNWMKSANEVSKIKSMVPKEQQKAFTERVVDFSALMKGMSLFFFIGTFIAVLFFIATGSILYFKLFNEIQKDRQEFISLKKMGMSQDEVKKNNKRSVFHIIFPPLRHILQPHLLCYQSPKQSFRRKLNPILNDHRINIPSTTNYFLRLLQNHVHQANQPLAVRGFMCTEEVSLSRIQYIKQGKGASIT